MGRISAILAVLVASVLGAWLWFAGAKRESRAIDSGPSTTTPHTMSAEREPLPLFLAIPDTGNTDHGGVAAKSASDDGATALLESVTQARAAGRDADADRLLGEAVQKFPNDARTGSAAVDRAKALLGSPHPEDGEAMLRLVTATGPRTASAVHASLVLAERLVRQGKLPDAAKLLAASLAENRDTPFESDLKKALEPVVQRVYFSGQVFPDTAFSHVVSKGDSLDRLVKTWRKDKGINVTPGFVARVNGLADPSRIQPGMTLKVPSAPLRIEVSKQDFRLALFCGDVPILERRVGLGKGGKTPEGTFVVRDKQVHPVWFKPGEAIPFGDPRNPLGTRWMGFEATEQHAGYGIHGTTEPDSIGKEMSDGCIRMLNAEVEDLFDLVPPGTEVKIVL
ncbi:MAG: L,D-transpeptidase family protein [Planctomycetes bacterium]|nr:L,D-transpeptidase family protein [Planctomycetota bacterium]MBI3846773.1 L,D-transpeptidase family protein [Planctomycetota bacterium]